MDPASRRAELVEQALQYGWNVYPGAQEFRAYQIGDGPAARRHTVQVALSQAGVVLAATIDGRAVSGANKLALLVAALRRGAPSYRAGRASNKTTTVHWVPRQGRGDIPPQALCGGRVTGGLDPATGSPIAGHWFWSHTDPVNCARCLAQWASAITALRDWDGARRAAAPTVYRGVQRVYGGATTGGGTP